MAFVRVQGASANSGSASASTVAVTISAVASGNAVLGVVSWVGAGTLTSVTDNKGNTYNKETSVLDTTDSLNSAAFSRTNITNAPTVITANFSAGVTFRQILVDEFSGGSTASTDERDGAAHGGQFQGNPGTAANGITSGTFTTATNGDLIWGATVDGAGTLALATNGTSFSTGTQFNATDYASQTEFRTQTTAGAGTAATFTQAADVPRTTFMVAIKPAAGGAAPPNGWSRDESEILPKPPVRFAAPPPAFVSTFKTAAVSGIAWFEPPDRDRPPFKARIESPPAIALTPATLPPQIAGMAWFEPPDSYQPRRLGKSEPAAFGRAIAQPSTIAGMAWFEPWDVLQQQRRGKDEPHPLVRAPVSIVVPPQSASDVFQARRPAKDEPHPFVTAPAAIVAPPVLAQDVLAFRRPGRDEPHPFVAPPQPTLWPPQLVQDIFWSRRPLASDLAFVIPPPDAGTPISGMAWFEPWDRDRPALKVSVEASVALVLTPDTLPPVISGMAWFEPWDTRQPPPPRVHMADVFPAGVFSTDGTATPTEPPPPEATKIPGGMISGREYGRRRKRKTSREELDEILAELVAEIEGPKTELEAKRAARRVVKRAKHDGRLEELKRQAEEVEHKRLDQAELIEALADMAQRRYDDEMGAVLLLLSH